jgi:hypothetical protein
MNKIQLAVALVAALAIMTPAFAADDTAGTEKAAPKTTTKKEKKAKTSKKGDKTCKKDDKTCKTEDKADKK